LVRKKFCGELKSGSSQKKDISILWRDWETESAIPGERTSQEFGQSLGVAVILTKKKTEISVRIGFSPAPVAII
jgi:hypothetical protein